MAILCIAMISILSCKKSTQKPSPVADFSYSGAGLAPSNVVFTNNSINAITYLWDFGDNTTSTQASPFHVYKKGGVYTVSLTANNEGLTNKISKTVNIQSPTSLKITSIKLLAMPFTNSSGAGWDNNGTGPDPYCLFTDNNDVALLTGNTFNDITSISSSGLIWNITPSYQITNLSATYKIKIMDDDSPLSSDFIGGYTFNFSSFTTTEYPTNIVLQLSGSALKIELTVQWY